MILSLEAEYERDYDAPGEVHGFIVLTLNGIVIIRLPVSGNLEAFLDDPRGATEVAVAEWLAVRLEEGK